MLQKFTDHIHCCRIFLASGGERDGRYYVIIYMNDEKFMHFLIFVCNEPCRYVRSFSAAECYVSLCAEKHGGGSFVRNEC